MVTQRSSDLLLLQGLFSLFPFASADAEARSALWSIIARLLIQVQEIELSPLQLHQYVSVITSETEVIEEELLDHQSNDSNEECGSSATLAKLAARNVAVSFQVYECFHPELKIKNLKQIHIWLVISTCWKSVNCCYSALVYATCSFFCFL